MLRFHAAADDIRGGNVSHWKHSVTPSLGIEARGAMNRQRHSGFIKIMAVGSTYSESLLRRASFYHDRVHDRVMTNAVTRNQTPNLLRVQRACFASPLAILR